MLAVAIALAAVIAQQTDFGVRSPDEEPPVAEPRAASNGLQTPSATNFNCAVAKVTDGDTFRCSNGVRVRLSAIDTPEMPGSCQKGRPCAPGNPFAAKAALARLISGKTVRCEQVGTSYNRVAAWCSINGADLSCAMVRSGHAIRLPKYDRGRLCR